MSSPCVLIRIHKKFELKLMVKAKGGILKMTKHEDYDDHDEKMEKF
jgi:hypothetical protein